MVQLEDEVSVNGSDGGPRAIVDLSIGECCVVSKAWKSSQQPRMRLREVEQGQSWIISF